MTQGEERRSFGWLLGLALTGWLYALPVQAEPSTVQEKQQKADKVFEEAKKALDSNELANAKRLFLASNAIVQRPRTLRMLATVEGRLDMVGPAYRHIQKALSLIKEEGKPSRLQQAELKLSKRLLAELEPRCGFVRVAFAASVLNEKSSLKINDRLIERDRWSLRHAVTPGSIRIELAGHPPKTIQAKAGTVHGVEFQPIDWATEVVTAPPTKPQPETTQSTPPSKGWRNLPALPVLALGLGSALFITGGVTSIRTSIVAANLDERCGEACEDSVVEANQTRQQLAVASLVLGTGFIAGGVVALLLRKSSSDETKKSQLSWSPILSPRQIGLRILY